MLSERKNWAWDRIKKVCMCPSESVANILLTIDVEDWFQVENFKPWISFYSWPSRELRVEKNTHRILDLLDLLSGQGTKLQATFFILGWIAEHLPNLVREIHARGHEVGSHGYNHDLCYQQPHEDLVKDLTASKKLLEDITGAPVLGYRAPNFSISSDTLKTIQDCGYLYDSSYNSFAMHGRYGKLDLSVNGKKGIGTLNPSQSTHDPKHAIFYELPISNLILKISNSKFILPWGGGGYFRMIPLQLFAVGVSNILKKDKAYLFYIHPWEIDPDQPRVNEASAAYKFRHYINLNNTQTKLSKFIKIFQQHRFITCGQYIKEVLTA